ncbi:MAG TPA: hypothetical protein DCS43_13815 [Verrucomicrobia bacterium]|nr:hypothetical protein [Verrucomicrobiota bacterium]
MKIKRAMVAVLAWMLVVGGMASTLEASTMQTPLWAGSVSDRLSIGVGYEKIERSVSSDQFYFDILEADCMYGYVGIDALHWLTVFVTGGTSELKGQGGESDSGMRLSGGLDALLWKSDVLVPEFLAGRLSIRSTAELLYSESDVDRGTLSWMEYKFAIPVEYEIYERSPVGSSGVQTSLVLYAGPVVSFLDGDADVGMTSIGFKAQEELGVLAGFDVYFAPEISIGVNVTVLDETSYGASLRFHF